MYLKKNFWLHTLKDSTDLLLKKILVKYLYTKFLIYHCSTLPKKKLLLLDNYLNFFNIKVRKKRKYLKRFLRLKSSTFFKGDLFVFKHSKLKFHFFISIRSKLHFKKNLYFTLNLLKTELQQFNTLVVYKIIRGGFLAISNRIVGYVPKNLLFKSKKSFLKYKRYYLLRDMCCLTNQVSNLKSLTLYKRTTSKMIKSKFKRSRFKSKKLKFLFNSTFFIYKKTLDFFYVLATLILKFKKFSSLKKYYSLMFSKVLYLLSL